MAIAHTSGRSGEAAAAAWLQQQGCAILATNWRGGGGELDIVAQDASGLLLFVEVKRRTAKPGTARPELAVTPAKQRRMVQAALRWLAAHGHENTPARFDVIAITATAGGGQQELLHFPDAFRPLL